MKSLSRYLAAFGLVVGVAVTAAPFATSANAVGGITYYVNSVVNTGALDCATPTNVDCGIGDAIGSFNDDSTINDADSIDFASGVATYVNASTAINNATSGVTLAIDGNGPSETTVTAVGNVFLIFGGVVTISGLTITGGTYPYGGGVYNAGTVNLEGDAISDNSADLNGGGVYNSGTATLMNDTLSGDTSMIDGGGVMNAGIISMTNDTFEGESADFGGGFLNAGTATLFNDTFAQDYAGSSGSGIFNDQALTIGNSVFSDASCFDFGTITDDGYNVESDASCGSNPTDITNSSSINLAPSLAANGSNGPSTLAIDPTSSAYEVVPASNCLFATDERGDPRPGVPGASCDAGAYEYQAPAAAVTPRSDQFITFSPIANVFLGVAPFSLSPVASSGLAVTLTSQDPSVCTTSGLTVSVLSVGTCGLVASQGGNGQFLPTAIVQSFEVAAVIAVHVPGRAHIRRAIAFTRGRVALDVSPPSNGGSRITSYEYSVNGEPWVSVGFGGRVVVTGLKASRVVRLRVRARNAVGVGPSSNTVRVIAR